MTYTKLLNKLIEQANLTNKDILEQCEKLGMKITPNYLSVLKNNDTKIASDELSRILAKICKAESEEILVVQAYLDKAPSIIIECLTAIYNNGYEMVIQSFEMNKDKFPKELYDTLLEQTEAEFNKMCLAEFICLYPTMLKEAEEQSYIKTTERGTSRINTDKPSKKWAIIPIETEDDIKIINN